MNVNRFGITTSRMMVPICPMARWTGEIASSSIHLPESAWMKVSTESRMRTNAERSGPPSTPAR